MLALIVLIVIVSVIGRGFLHPFGYRRYHGFFGPGLFFRPPMGGMHGPHPRGPMGGMHHMGGFGGPMGGGHMGGFGGGMGRGGPGRH